MLRNPKANKRLTSILVAIALMTTSTGFAQQPPTPVLTQPVKSERVQEHRRVTGSLQAIARSSVASQEAGQILAVETDEGMTVEAGDIIARLDARRLEAQLAEARARIDRIASDLVERESEVKFADYEYKRLAKLLEKNVASERELMEASTQLSAAEARAQSAQRSIAEGQRQVDYLTIRLADMTVRAPFSARVVARHVDIGEWIEPGEPIVTLVSTGAIEARLEVPERYAAAVSRNVGQIYADVIGAGRTIPSTSVRIIPDVNPQARIFGVILTLENIDNALAPGMSVTAWIPTSDEADHLTVPKSAVVRSGRDAYVYRTDVSPEGAPTAAKMPVTVLFDWEDRVVIAANDLRAGDNVIVEGNERLMPGATLALADKRE